MALMFRDFTDAELKSYISSVTGNTKGQRIVRAAAIKALAARKGK